MKQSTLCFFLLLFFIHFVSAQSPTPEKVRTLIAHAWKISSISHKTASSDKYVAFTNTSVAPCFYEGNFFFRPDEVIDLKTDKSKCGYTDSRGKWTLSSDNSQLTIKLDSLTNAITFKILTLSASQLTLEATFEEKNHGTTRERIIFEPAERKGIYMSQLYEMTKLTVSDHATAVTSMGFTPNGHNAAGKYYSFKKGTEGILKLYYDDNETFSQVIYTTNEMLPQSSIWEFGNNNRFYLVSSIESRPSSNDNWMRTDKHYKEGYVYEANQLKKTYSAVRGISAEDKDRLTKNYKNTRFPEIGVTGSSNSSGSTEVKAATVSNTQTVSTSADFCKDLNVIIKAMENGKMGDLVDYNKGLGITKSWYEAKVPLKGFTSLQGQNMWGYLTFSGSLTGSDTEDNLSYYNQLVTQMASCLGSSYSKKVNESSVRFTSRNNEKLSVTVDYWGKGKRVRISVERSSS